LAASRMWAGVSKSGSPISRWTTLLPCRSRARARASTSKAVSVPSRPIRSATRIMTGPFRASEDAIPLVGRARRRAATHRVPHPVLGAQEGLALEEHRDGEGLRDYDHPVEVPHHHAAGRNAHLADRNRLAPV